MLEHSNPEVQGLAGAGNARRLGWGFWVSVGWIGLVVFGAVFADVLPLPDPLAPLVGAPREGPGAEHWFGTDLIGRSVFSRLVFGARVSLVIALGATSIGLITGGVLGLVAGYRRRRTETIIMALADLALAFPALVLVLAVVSFAGSNLRNILIVMGVLGIPSATRIVRGVTLSFAEREFVTAAKALGAKDLSIMVREILPNVLIPAMSFFFIGMAIAIVTEGSLAFLGLSVQPPTPTWGGMIADGRVAIDDVLHIALIPAAAMFLTVLAFNFAGDKLRELTDIREGVLAGPAVSRRHRRPAAPSSEIAETTLLEVDGLYTYIGTEQGVVRAVDGVSLVVERGTTLGVVGESGSGKSMLIRSILGLASGSHFARSGRVTFDGRDLSGLAAEEMRDVLGTRIGAVFQNPMTALNPVRSIGSQLAEPLMVHLELSKRQALERAVELLESVNVPDPARRLRQYPHHLSGGLRQRVTIALALACDPELLFADEPTTALDVTVQDQILRLLRQVQQERDMGMVLVTHDLAVVRGWADQIAVMYGGRVVEIGPVGEIFERPMMPYTEALLQSTPRLLNDSHTELHVIPGSPPDLIEPATGCRFAPRCAYVREKCLVDEPQMEEGVVHGHAFACWFPLNERVDA